MSLTRKIVVFLVYASFSNTVFAHTPSGLYFIWGGYILAPIFVSLFIVGVKRISKWFVVCIVGGAVSWYFIFYDSNAFIQFMGLLLPLAFLPASIYVRYKDAKRKENESQTI